jgi:hypothetical protein
MLKRRTGSFTGDSTSPNKILRKGMIIRKEKRLKTAYRKLKNIFKKANF